MQQIGKLPLAGRDVPAGVRQIMLLFARDRTA